ncbi:DeoR/GlpR transcriptional regulator [Anaerolineae bacterium CFX9]|jgi:DeoR family fructose operon transcriptional repressor|nr:DeoR/GlpR family DNA-binding transcription regulator [Geitlerinema splendidum]MDK3160585.1 DeoR/GlpR family DNA-binding transcription regulator [Kamptonema cortianum]MDL1901456.1 DeoR/GlpR transcriptional regulator [Anaerolineae bacterium CFX9]
MPDSLFVEERRRIILDQLKQKGRVSVKELSQAMQVSTVTIRQDLRTLEESGLLERTYGGAVRRENAGVFPELSFHVRLNKKRRDKDAIAAYAVDFVRDGYSIALDGSTTAFSLVGLLKAFRKITIVTNSLIIAQQFLDAPHVQVYLPGGRLRRDSISIVGSPDTLPDINLNVGFFGARGIAMTNGITDVDADEVSIKQAMMAHCVSSIILVDGTKWGQVAPYTMARFSQVERIITSDDAPGELVAAVRAAGTRVDVVNVSQRNGG